MASPGANLTESMQDGGTWRAKKPVRRLGPKPHDAGKACFNVAKFHRTYYRGKVSTEGPNGRAIVGARIYRRSQEDRGAGEWCDYSLRDGAHATCHFWRTDRITLHRI
jgi:hypothetical protein